MTIYSSHKDLMSAIVGHMQAISEKNANVYFGVCFSCTCWMYR